MRTVDVDAIERRAAHSSELRAYALADALAGGDARAATQLYLRLREQGERLSGLVYLIASRLRDALSVAQRLESGESAAAVKRGLRMPSRAADRLIADVQRSSPERLRAALGALADLELDSRGGAVVTSIPLDVGRARRGHRRGQGDREDRRLRGATCPRERGRRGTSCARRCCGAARPLDGLVDLRDELAMLASALASSPSATSDASRRKCVLIADVY